MQDTLRTLILEHPTVKGLFAAISLFVFDEPVWIMVMIGVTLLDATTGIWKSLNAGTFESRKLGRTAFKIVAYAGVIGVCHWVGKVVEPIAFIDKIVVAWFIVTEFISVLENLGEMGVPLPRFLLEKLASVRKALESKTEQTGA